MQLKNIPMFLTKFANITKLNVRRNYIKEAKTSHENKNNLVIEFEKEIEEYPYVWLRDNCTCPKCFHNDSQSRIINWNEFDVDVKPVSLQVNRDKVEIKWSDNHSSIFTEDWLLLRSFKAKTQIDYLNENYRPKKTYWEGHDFYKILKKYQYDDVFTKDETLYNFLKDLAVYGVVLLKNTPKNADEISKLAKRIAFIRETHYGKEFIVASKPGTNNVAYLSNFLQLHTDLPYYEYKPGTTFLHCLIQTESEGGQSMLSDSFFVGEKMRREMKSQFDLLSSIEVNWSDYGTENGIKFCSLYRSPVIRLDSESQISCIRHSIPQRDSYFSVPIEKVTPWYKALYHFIRLLNQNSVRFKLNPGDLLAFDNTRVIHGRLKYEDKDNNQRYLIGMYIDWDEIYSKIRILKESLKK